MFSLIIVLTVVGVFLLSNYLLSSDAVSMKRKNILDYEASLKAGKYSEIPAAKLFGKNGFLEIADVQGNVVYSTKPEKGVYTVGELDIIKRFGVDGKIELSRFESLGGQRQYLITKNVRNSEGGFDQLYTLLDSDLKIISSTITPNKTSMTENEFNLLTYGYFNEGEIMRYSFTDENGVPYTAVFLDTVGDVNFAPAILVGVSIGVSFIIYIVLLVLFIIYTNKKVQQPLTALDNALGDFARNKYRVKVQYKGAREFEKVTESFNNMVAILDETERERDALEKEKQRMLAGLSHDLKTPLTVIRGYSKAMRDGLVKSEDANKYLEVIISKSDHMAELVSEMSEYNKLEHPDFTLRTEKKDIAEMTRRYLIGRYDELELAGHGLVADIAEDKIICEVDEKQFLRIYDNLFSNALKYNPDGVNLRVAVSDDNGRALITVADDGVGISDNAREDIFNPFVVGEESRSKQGSGLGLAICKKIVEAHGGKIGLSERSDSGYATEFFITLPLAKPINSESLQN